MFAIILVPLLPLLAALIVLVGDEASRQHRAKIAAYPIGAAFLGAIVTLWYVATQGAITIRFYDPASLAMLAFPVGFYVDRLSAVMMVLISGVGTIIYTYSIGYMYQDRHDRRYLALIGFTTSVLLCMVSSVNLMMLFLFWQILSYMLYLLAHNHTHIATLEGAFRTFTLLRVGDVAFLTGIVLAHQLYGTLEFQALFAKAAESTVTLSPWPGIEIGGATAVTLLLFIGAMSKSAQFPIHIWLPRSLYAPTPVHALLHAGIINAGGFLINRLAPLYGLSSTTLHVAFVVGTLTAILGATMMLAQNDIKKTLGFSTIGQMGYMIMECGLGAFSLAVFHLIAHGLFKATVFLNCGNVIHKARQEPESPHADPLAEEQEFSRLTWFTGFMTTLLIPLLILLVTHGVLRIPLLESQGTVIFLFFIWITSSQAILTLTRLRAVASWKVSSVMLLTLLFVVFVYLFAVESFTAFLYPNSDEVASYFQAAALPNWLFDGIVIMATVLTVLSWCYLYMRAHGQTLWVPDWVEGLRLRLYVLFMNRLYMDELYHALGRAVMRVVHRIDRRGSGEVVGMIDATTAPWLLAAIPILGALLILVVWSQPEKLKIWSISVTLVSLLAVVGTLGRMTVSAEGLLFVLLLPLAACVSLLGQPVHQDHRLAWVMTLLFLGLGLGILTSQHLVSQIGLCLLLGLITFLLYRQHNPFWPTSWLGIGTYGLGTLCAGLAAIAGPPISSVASLMACAILLPLVPFHDGYVTVLSRLPGSLPSFIVLLLPAIGLHNLAAAIQTAPDVVVLMMTTFALVGALYGSVKALAQSRVRLLLAYGSFSLFSILWWFVAASRTVTPQAAVFLGAVALVTSGLLLAWQVVRTRYGDDVDPRAISGLASPMPQFAILFSLLALAAMGLPPFGVFAGFMGLLFASSFTSSAALVVIVIAWLAASWYILETVQRLLFGRQRSDLRYEDLRRSEFASLLIVVLIVIALGVAPANLFGMESQPPRAGAVMEFVTWIR